MSRLSFGWRKASTQEDIEERKTAPVKYNNPFKQNTPPIRRKKDDFETSEEYSEYPSQLSDKLNGLSTKDKSRIRNMLMSSKTYLADKNFKEQKWQYHMYEREMKKALTNYFNDLTEKFVGDRSNKLEFFETVKNFIYKNSGLEVAEVLRDSDNLIWKTLEMVKNLNEISDNKAITTNVEKLKLYISVLSSQLTMHNQKYFINKQMAEKVIKEKKYLQEHDMGTLETQNKWCQIDVSLVSSDITIEVQSAKRLKVAEEAVNVFCLMKVNDISIGKTPVISNTANPVWDTALTLELTKDFAVEHFSFEVYNDPASPVLIGECHITLDEILDNTLFNNKFSVYLPLASARKSAGSTSETTENMKQELIDTIDEREFDNYLNSIFHEGDNSGILKLSFQIRLDNSFCELVDKLRLQRLENLEVLTNENDANLQEQFKFLKTSVAPICTIEVDPALGLIGTSQEVKPKEKRRESLLCAVCVPGGKNNCNLF